MYFFIFKNVNKILFYYQERRINILIFLIEELRLIKHSVHRSIELFRNRLLILDKLNFRRPVILLNI